MSKVFLLVIFFLNINFLLAQDIINWETRKKLSLSDFQSSSSQIGDINQYSILPSAKMDFAFQMNSYEFMFTKNFNSKVSTIFTKSASVIIAPDSVTAQKLVNFAQLNFDLVELYARKFRKKLYESKGTFSNYNFFQNAYADIEKEYNSRFAEIGKITDVGQSKERTEEIQKQILNEILDLDDFCKSCKAKKKKNKD